MHDPRTAPNKPAAPPKEHVTEWRALLLAARHENDKDALAELIARAENAIFLRCQELAQNPGDSPEVREIKNAVDELYALRIKKLGKTDPLAP